MANTIYVEATKWTPALDSKAVAKDYNEEISIIAECMSKLKEVENQFKYLSEKTGDNSDPQFELHEAICSLGEALATSISYRDEYVKEANGDNSEEKE